MAFSELPQHGGNLRRFQILLAILSLSLNILFSTQNFVENFSSAIPSHRCYIHLLDNTTPEINLTMNLKAETFLRISTPMDANKKQEQCHWFHQTQWQLLNPSDLAINNTELETEPCLDSWTYDQSIFTSTVVTQV
uniref:Uncharacterized protein n=1 Tax=Catagonus wagneri TaxID=51154 RepID=A0A8C3WXG0_9CETA